MTEDQAVEFEDAFQAMAESVHATAVAKGFWEGGRNDGEAIALMHSELSELLEGLRHGNPPDQHLPQFTSAEVEAADLIIRLMDLAVGRAWNVGEAITAKARYNRGRPHRHGKEF